MRCIDGVLCAWKIAPRGRRVPTTHPCAVAARCLRTTISCRASTLAMWQCRQHTSLYIAESACTASIEVPAQQISIALYCTGVQSVLPGQVHCPCYSYAR